MTFSLTKILMPCYVLAILACMLSGFSCAQIFVTLRTIAHQVPLGESPGKNTGMGCHALLQGIFLIQGLKLSLVSPCIGRQVLYN